MITNLQRMWLNIHGGRDERDIFKIGDDYFIEMNGVNGNTVTRILPSDKGINRQFKVVPLNFGLKPLTLRHRYSYFKRTSVVSQ